MNGGQAVVEVLKREGVTKVFGVPGESYLSVLDALYDNSQIQFISNRHEGGAAFMAEGFAKSSGGVGICMATRGVGASNLSIGVHTAYQDSTPMVLLIGQVERPFEFRDAFQEVDLLTFFKPISKWVVSVRDVYRIPELLHRAFYVARSGRPGPVVVMLPQDMLEDQVNFDIASLKGAIGSYALSGVRAIREEIDRARDILISAKQPVVIVGGGVIRSGARDILHNLAERLQLPVVTAFRRFDAFPNDHACYAGWLGFGSHKELLHYIRSVDVVLVIGTRLSQVTTQDYTLFGYGTKLIHVDISQDVFGKSFPPTLPIVSDAKEFIVELMHSIENYEFAWNRDQAALLHKTYLEFSTPRTGKPNGYVDLDILMADFILTVPEDTIITSDAGNFFGWISRFYRFRHAGTYIGPTSGAMGYGLPAAIGAKLAHRDRIVISFSGDGGFMMTMQEFETALRYQIPIVAVIINNSLYGTIRAHQEHHFPGRVVGTSLSNPDYANLAVSFGGYGERVSRNDQFIPALERALNSGKPALIEVITDPNILSVSDRI